MLDRIVDGSLQAAVLQHRQRLDQRAAQRLGARAVHHVFERVIPERDQAAAVDHRDAFVQRFDGSLAAVLVFDLAHVGAVGAVCEEQRERGDRQHFPESVIR